MLLVRPPKLEAEPMPQAELPDAPDRGRGRAVPVTTRSGVSCGGALLDVRPCFTVPAGMRLSRPDALLLAPAAVTAAGPR